MRALSLAYLWVRLCYFQTVLRVCVCLCVFENVIYTLNYHMFFLVRYLVSRSQSTTFNYIQNDGFAKVRPNVARSRTVPRSKTTAHSGALTAVLNVHEITWERGKKQQNIFFFLFKVLRFVFGDILNFSTRYFYEFGKSL